MDNNMKNGESSSIDTEDANQKITQPISREEAKNIAIELIIN